MTRMITSLVLAISLLVAAIAMAATVAGSGLDASIESVQTNPDGSAVIRLLYKNASGQPFASRTLYVPALRTSAIVDNRGAMVSATVPSGLATAIDAFNAQLNTTLANAAAAGKLDL